MPTFDIYLINLDKDSDRLSEMKEKLSPNEFVRIPGVYGKETDFENYDEIVFSSKYLTPKSVLGCALSHRKALQTFLQDSKKDYALIIEDDATPVSPNYMNEIQEAIQNAPSDWDVIKLDYLPKYNIPRYHSHFSFLATAYLVNKRGAEKMLRESVFHHIDFDMNFYNMKMYNNPTIVFEQIWDEKNHSNNRNDSYYNPFRYLCTHVNFKVLRIFNQEFTFADFFLLIAILILLWMGFSLGRFSLGGFSLKDKFLPNSKELVSQPKSRNNRQIRGNRKGRRL